MELGSLTTSLLQPQEGGIEFAPRGAQTRISGIERDPKCPGNFRRRHSLEFREHEDCAFVVIQLVK